jgi:tRNA (guanine-N7-)-methyltransferase
MQDVIFAPQDYFRELPADELFPDQAGRPLEVDLGCGEGAFLVAMAKAYPDRVFLGIERMGGRVSTVANLIRQDGLTNARILRLESSYAVGWLLRTQSVQRLHLLCPDPWPKSKHEERRLVAREEFQRGLARILAPGGEFLFKTDDAPYHELGTAQFDALPEFTRLDWPEEAFPYPMTNFEQHWLSQGKVMHRARWQRR